MFSAENSISYWLYGNLTSFAIDAVRRMVAFPSPRHHVDFWNMKYVCWKWIALVLDMSLKARNLCLCVLLLVVYGPLLPYVTASLFLFFLTLPTPHKTNILAFDLESLRYVLRHPRFAVWVADCCGTTVIRVAIWICYIKLDRISSSHSEVCSRLPAFSSTHVDDKLL